MRLSEAIRLGAMVKPQAIGQNVVLRDGVTDGEKFKGWDDIKSTCAMGAALLANGAEWRRTTPIEVGLRGDRGNWAVDIPVQWRFNTRCPLTDCKGYQFPVHSAQVVVAHLNDDHRWTREQIADWVATVEPQEVRDPLPMPQPMPLPKPFEPLGA